MGDLTAHFDAHELLCPCGKCDGGTMSPDFMAKLERLRAICGFPFDVNSGFRCRDHNADVGGRPESLHLAGRAADISAPDFADKERIVRNAYSCGLRGVGVGPHFIHVDDREMSARWAYR